MDELFKLAQIVNQAAQVLALVVGASWAYFKFIRGRTFARRGEVEVEGVLRGYGQDWVVQAKVLLRNTGLSRLPLRQRSKIARLYGTSRSKWSTERNFGWEKLMLTPVLEKHAWVEAQESVKDEVLIPVRQGDWLALKIEVEIWGKPHRGRRTGSRWMATTIVTADVASEVTHADHHHQAGTEI